MARRGGSIYISTDPNVVLAIGTPGVGISIGPLGNTIYAPTTGGFNGPEVSGDLAYASILAGAYSSSLAIAGGTAPYTLTTITGLPADFAAAIVGSTVAITSAAITSLPGKYPLSITVTDTNSVVSLLYEPILTITP